MAIFFKEDLDSDQLNNVNEAGGDDISFKDRMKGYNDEISDVNDSLSGNTLDSRSAVARAKDSICQFPIFITRSIRINEAQAITNMVERYFASVMQSVFTANQVIRDDELDKMQFLKRYHTNMVLESSVFDKAYDEVKNEFYEAIDQFDQYMMDSIYRKVQINENVSVEFKAVPSKISLLNEASQMLCNEPLAGLQYLLEDEISNIGSVAIPGKEQQSYDTLEDLKFFVKQINDSNTTATPDALDLTDEEIELIGTPAPEPDPNTPADEIPDHPNVDEIKREVYRFVRDNPGVLKSPANTPVVASMQGTNALLISRKVNDVTTTVKRPMGVEKIPTLLKDIDIKKTNSMVPYTLEVNFMVSHDNKYSKGSTITKTAKYAIGIKAVLHPIEYRTLVEELPSIISGSSKSLGRIRWKTGEISLMDKLLNLKDIKSSALNTTKKDNRWINTLRRLGEYKNLNGTLFKPLVRDINVGGADLPEGPIPNGTLVLTSLDVANLDKEVGIDLTDLMIAKRVVKSLHLVGILIMDVDAGTLKRFMPDELVDWDVQSLATINQDLAQADNGMKRELNRIINR